MKNIIIASTSTLYGCDYLEYLLKDLEELYKDIKDIIFVPYARPDGISHELYTKKVSAVFKRIKKSIKGLHEFKNPEEAIKNCEAIFVGGGNTFVLVNELQKNNLIDPIKKAVCAGVPYLGTSAGSNICGINMQTTNDMPIVYPTSFDTLGLIPFNINPHYLDIDLNNKHMGESRETRINEFHQFNNQTVIGLREGSFLRINGDIILLKGPHSARIFRPNKTAYELKTNDILEANN
ncbi:dipeptidase PepE [Flavobacteriaceae bacterium]|nr:dipeptidase PepE [Flavobacteriaceae bacterium]